MKVHMPTEHAEAVCLFRLVSLHEKAHPELLNFTAVPHGGFRHKATAGKLRAEGVRAGYPDFLLDVPRGEFHGLRIELKRRKSPPSAVSDEQHGWHQRLRAQGYRIEVCRGWEEAWAVVCDYLNITERTAR